VTDRIPEPWEVLESRYLLRSPWRDIRVDRIRLHTGAETEYSYFEMHDAALVVPLTVEGQIVLLRQYRHPPRAWVLEVVGGMIGPEGAPECARRELAEEIGGRCRQLVPVASYYAVTASSSARNHAFVALDVELGEPDREDMELLDTVLLDPDDAFARARDGRIDDGQSALALLMAEPIVRAHLARRGG